MSRRALILAASLACICSPARAGILFDLFSPDASWMATARGGLASIAARYVGQGNFTGFRGPWCAVAMSQWLGEATGRNPHIFRARDFARFGRRSPLVPGALIVRPHHVSVYAGDGYEISGNGRGHRVHMGKRSLRDVIAVRAP